MPLTSVQASSLPRYVRRAVRALICLAVAAPVIYLLVQHLADMDREQIATALAQIPVWALVVSAGLSFLSLIAVARYDRLALGQIGARVPDELAIRGGFAAVGLGQTLGFGLLVGTFVRWRMYRNCGVSVGEAGLVSAIVAAGFTLGFCGVLAIVTFWDQTGLAILTGAAPSVIQNFALAGMGAFALVLFGALAQPSLKIGRWTLRFPPVNLLLRQTVLAALDVVPAALALFVLIPASADIPLATLIPVYLAALGVGLVANTPGGLGVLELACLTALPVVPPETLLAALIAHRALYFGLPALIAAAILVAREVHGAQDAPNEGHSRLPGQAAGTVPARVENLINRDNRADAALAYLGDKDFLVAQDGSSALAVARAGNSLIALSEPLGGREDWQGAASDLSAEAVRRGLSPVFYKVGPQMAASLENDGWTCVQCAAEAVVDVANFSLEGSKRRELRRKQRAAEKAGITITCHAPGEFDIEALRPVAQAWSEAHRKARGFSMGHFYPAYLARFDLIVARRAGQIVGFVSVWRSGDGSEAGIDVLRLLPDAADGTMHALMIEAIGLARDLNCTRFTLAAVPLAGIAEPRNLVERVLARMFEKAKSCAANRGLYRFKQAFRPEWSPRFVAARHQPAVACGLVEVGRLINRSGRL